MDKITKISDFQDKKATEIVEFTWPNMPVGGYRVTITGEYKTYYGYVTEWSFMTHVHGDVPDGVFHIISQRAMNLVNHWLKREKIYGESDDD